MPRIRKIILTLKTVKKTLLGVFAIDMKTIAMGEERGNTTGPTRKMSLELRKSREPVWCSPPT